MIVRIPKLAANGSVELHSAADHDALWHAHLCRGALPVRPEIPLQNFTYLNVQLTGAHLLHPVPCRCEVVVVQTGRVLLRVADDWPDEYERLAVPADAWAIAADANTAIPGNGAPAARADAPSPPSTAEEVGPYPSAPPQERLLDTAVPDDDAARPDADPPVSVTPQTGRAMHAPAYLDDVSLRFFSREHLSLHEDALRSERLCVAFAERPLRENVILSRNLSTTDHQSQTFCVFEVRTAHEGLLYLHVVDIDALERALDEVLGRAETNTERDVPPHSALHEGELPAEFTTDVDPDGGFGEFSITNWTDRKKLPTLGDGRLDFGTEFDFIAARDDLLAVGATMATSSEALNAPQVVNLQISLSGTQGMIPMRATLTPTGGPNVVVQFQNLKHLAAAIDAGWQPLGALNFQELAPRPKSPVAEEVVVLQPSASPASAPGPARGPEIDESPVPLVLPFEGRLENPTTVAGILKNSLMRPPRAYELEPPSLFMLFRWLLTTSGTLQVEIDWEDRASHPIYIIDGSRFRAPVEARTLSRPFAFVSGSYRIQDVDRPPSMTHNGRTAHLFMHILRSWMLVHTHESLEEALAHRLTQAPKLTQTGRTLVDRLGFDGANRRIALHKLDGSFMLDEVLQSAAGNRSALETIYMLMIAEGLEWLDAPVEGRATAGQKVLQAQASLPPEEQFWQKIEKANYFVVLGLHWSVAPFEIPEAYNRLVADWGPEGRMRATAHRQTVDKIWGRICEARDVLNDKSRRREYRKQTFQLQWSQQVGLLIENAQLASYRNDSKEAMRLLLAADDVLPTSEGARLLRKLRKGEQLIDEIEPEAQYEKKR